MSVLDHSAAKPISLFLFLFFQPVMPFVDGRGLTRDVGVSR